MTNGAIKLFLRMPFGFNSAVHVSFNTLHGLREFALRGLDSSLSYIEAHFTVKNAGFMQESIQKNIKSKCISHRLIETGSRKLVCTT